MKTPSHAALPPAAPSSSPTSSSKSSRLKSVVSVLVVMAGFGAYWTVFPDGILNAAVGVTPSAGTSVCLGIMKTPLCYVFGWSTTGSEATPFNVEYRKARFQVLATKYGMEGLAISGGPQFDAEADKAGFEHWLGHAPDAEFEQALAYIDTTLAARGSQAPSLPKGEAAR